MGALRVATPWLRRKLGERLSLRHVPELTVREDDSIASGDRVLRIIQELEEEARRARRQTRRGSRMLDVAEVLRGAERISAVLPREPRRRHAGRAIAIAMAAERLGKQAEVV